MRERPILFSAEMIRALLDGRKTQTRRTVNLNVAGRIEKGGRQWRVEDGSAVIACPYGVIGDELWVRETCVADELESGQRGVRYLADDAFLPIEYRGEQGEAEALWINLSHYRADAAGVATGKPVPSIHMPRWASRISLRITDVRVERLNDISNEDAAAEGWPGPDAENSIASSYPIAWYWHLWDKINGAGSYDLNPWIWAISFEVVK
jgi:hypothetical protein